MALVRATVPRGARGVPLECDRWVKKAVTVRCEAAFCSSSYAAAGKIVMPTKSAKNIGKTACIRMVTREVSTTLADLLTPLLDANPFSTVRHRFDGIRAMSATMA